MSEVGDDQVVGVVRAEGTLTTGGCGGYGVTHVFTVRDGKIVRFRETPTWTSRSADQGDVGREVTERGLRVGVIAVLFGAVSLGL